MYTAILAVATRSPVKINLTKTEQLLLHNQRIGMYIKSKIGIKNGIVHAVKDTCYLDCGSLNDCGQWHTFDNFPEIDYVVEESLPEISRFKATGFGEISGASGPASMMTAISNAIGVDYCEYPASREGILKALAKL